MTVQGRPPGLEERSGGHQLHHGLGQVHDVQQERHQGGDGDGAGRHPEASDAQHDEEGHVDRQTGGGARQ
jgi:hypothetical protein